MKTGKVFFACANLFIASGVRLFAEELQLEQGMPAEFIALGTNAPAVLWMEAVHGKVAGPEKFVFKAIWPDGRVLENWSLDRPLSPANMRRADPAAVRTLLEDIGKTGVFASNALVRTSYCGLDAAYWVIELSINGRHCRLESWHNLWAENPKLIVVNGAVMAKPWLPIGKHYRNSPEYSRFLETWELILEKVRKIKTE